MTRYSSEQIVEMRKSVIDARVLTLTYEPDGDYYVMEFEGGDGSIFEVSFRYMADLKDNPR